MGNFIAHLLVYVKSLSDDVHLPQHLRKSSKMDFRFLVPRKLVRVWYHWNSHSELLRFKFHSLSSKIEKIPEFSLIISQITWIQLNIVRDELNLVRTSINQIIEAKVLVDEVLASSQANVQSLRRQIHYFNDFEFRLEFALGRNHLFSFDRSKKKRSTPASLPE